MEIKKSTEIEGWSIKKGTVRAKFIKNKIMFLSTLEYNNGDVDKTCDDVGIHRRLFDRQLETDKKFAKEVLKINKRVARSIRTKFVSELANNFDLNAFRIGMQYGLIKGEDEDSSEDRNHIFTAMFEAITPEENQLSEMPDNKRNSTTKE